MAPAVSLTRVPGHPTPLFSTSSAFTRSLVTRRTLSRCRKVPVCEVTPKNHSLTDFLSRLQPAAPIPSSFSSLATKALKCCLIRAEQAVFSQLQFIGNHSSCRTQFRHNFSNERSNFVPCLVGATAVSCLHRFNERSHSFHIIAGFFSPISELDFGRDRA